MCVVAAKYLKDYGWVGAKNRDRNYKPELMFKQSFKYGVESLYLMDKITYYSEGINEYGLVIMNAATSVKNDESEAAAARRHAKKEAKTTGTYRAPDGIKIRKALKLSSAKDAAEYLASVDLRGNTLCFTADECYLLECGPNAEQLLAQKKLASEIDDYEWEKMDSEYRIKNILKNEDVIRTNHGHFLPWAGYQKDPDNEKMNLSRESSVKRFEYAKKNLKKAETPMEVLEALSKIEDTDSQHNPLRLGDYTKKTVLKTTGQMLFIPKKREFIYRPIWGNIDIGNINKLNSQKSKTYLNIVPYNTNESIVLDALRFM
jgi:hypothetical protein